jgi:Protein of unknown function (DUF3168)
VLEIAIRAALIALADGRVYPDEAPEGAARPFITFQSAGGQTDVVLAGATGTRNARVQFNVWAESRLSAAYLMEQVRTVVCDRSLATSLHGTPTGEPVSRHSPDTNWYGSQMDFSLWYSLQGGAG